MDDVLSGGHDITEAKEKMHQTVQLCKVGSFNLRKCLSNSPELLENLPGESLTKNCMSFFRSDNTTAVLRLKWRPNEDSFRFTIASFRVPNRVTKRLILSQTSKLFDPLG